MIVENVIILDEWLRIFDHGLKGSRIEFSGHSVEEANVLYEKFKNLEKKINIQECMKIYGKMVKEDENFYFFKGLGQFGVCISKHFYWNSTDKDEAFFPPPWNMLEYPEKTEGWMQFQREMRKFPEYYKSF